jgi:hypothetical protein
MFSSIYNWYYSTPEKYPQDLKIVFDKESRFMMIHPDGTVEFPKSYSENSVEFGDFSYQKLYISGEYLTKKNKFHRFTSENMDTVNPFASSLESLCNTRFENRYCTILRGPIVYEWVDPPSKQDIEELNNNYYEWATIMNSQ